jgi:hypothetical protein
MDKENANQLTSIVFLLTQLIVHGLFCFCVCSFILEYLLSFFVFLSIFLKYVRKYNILIISHKMTITVLYAMSYLIHYLIIRAHLQKCNL